MSLSDDDVLLIDKPAGWTSFDVVAKIRGARRAKFKASGVVATKKQLKVGHAGTLDPFATGLLVILLGENTKKATEFLKLDKVYEATIRLGQTSTTGDPEGEITAYQTASSDGSPKAAPPDRLTVETILKQFIGTIQQRPPAHSAIKIDGQRAYKLARRGEEVEMPLRTVTIHSLELLDYTYPDLKIRVHVGSGTYIRSLAVDIGEKLGTGAYCSQLRRTQIGDWSIASAQSIESVT